MNIHEYQAKNLLKKYNLPIPIGKVILDKASIVEVINELDFGQYVIKAQIHAGGRGKAGGVKLANNKKEAISIAEQMFGSILVTKQTDKVGKIVNKVYVETVTDIKKEYYFSVIVDTNIGMISLIASTEGGVEIEEIAQHNPEKIIKINVDPTIGIQNYHLVTLAYGLGLKSAEAKTMMQIVKNCYQCFVDYDLSQLEINPLVVNQNEQMLILDAKIIFDDNALFKHPEISQLRDETEEDASEAEARKNQLSYIKTDGNIGCVVNGAGLAMATMDMIKLYGGSPANFLDIGGGTNVERVTKAFNIILQDPKVRGILVNIFGGIVKCDIVAEGVINAAKIHEITMPIVVRLAGTNYDIAMKMLKDSGLSIVAADNLSDAVEKIVNLAKQ